MEICHTSCTKKVDHRSYALKKICQPMEVCKHSQLRSQNPQKILLIFATTTCFLLAHQATALSFNLANISSTYENNNNNNNNNNSTTGVIRVYGNASMISQGIQLTKPGQTWDAGRAVYYETLHLWDQASGNQSEFTAHFSFVIDSGGNANYGDGLSFFLTTNDSINSNIANSAGLGLPIRTPYTQVNPFVAVEFDTFFNPEWDPADAITTQTHVGIDINSLKSVASKPWYSDVQGGVENEARISYNPSLKILTVIFTDHVNNAGVESGFNYSVDLMEHLPEWVAICFGAGTGDSVENHYIKSWQFNSSLISVNPNSMPVLTPGPNPAGKNKNKALVVGLTIGGSSVLVVGGVLALVGFLLWKKRRSPTENIVVDEDEFETGPKKFRYDELSRATNNFSEEEKLGEGGFGGVYRGFLGGLNSYVAVKRISEASKQGIKEFASEVKIISQVRHRNLVLLIGWCHDERELLLVYEYMEKGSLDFHLFKEKSLLTWAARCKIARGLASALLYLHEECEQCVVHRDIKSSNVMLDSNFNAKLGDFGLARLVDHEKGVQTTILAGTRGYMAPEYLDTGRASKESDVYSFGVVMLEIACGRKPIDLTAEEEREKMVEWVWDLYGTGKLLEAVDPKLSSTAFDKEEMTCVIIVGLWCAHPDHNFRPSIRQAIHALNFEAPLPTLPAKMPKAMYFAPHELITPSSWGNSTSQSLATVSENSLLTSPR